MIAVVDNNQSAKASKRVGEDDLAACDGMDGSACGRFDENAFPARAIGTFHPVSCGDGSLNRHSQ